MQLHNPGQSVPLWLLSINAGLVEDVATGSAAGPIGAWLVDNNLAKENQEIILNQGGFLARPSILKIFVEAKNGNIQNVFVEGDACKIASGDLYI